MASGIEKFIGTAEEMLLKKVLGRIISETGMPICSNAVLEYCNVLKACSFSNADVILQSYMEIFDFVSLETWDSLMQPSLKHINIYFDQLFKTDLLQQVASEGLEPVKRLRDVEVFRVLLEFLRDLGRHQKSLEIVRTDSDESSAMVVLAEHLFSRLIPGQNYMVNDRSKDLPKHCPCNCKSEIKKGCTAIGSSATWHGYADIFLDQKIAVSILKENRHEKNESCDDDEGEPPPFKKLCSDDEEIKNDSTNNKNLMNIQSLDKVIAECITNAFAQVKRVESLSGWLIPTFSCTTEQILAVLYDPVNDILLHFIQVFRLWDLDTINLKSVVKIWMLLNFRTFTENNLSEKYELKKSTFHHCAKCVLDRYRKVECQTSFKCVKTDFYQDIIMPSILDKGERAPLKLCAIRAERDITEGMNCVA